MQKNYRLKIKVLFLFLVCGLSVFAQKNTSSPYSRYGIGDIVTQGKGRVVSMGGAGIALNSNLMLNGLNPAAHAALDSMSFLYEIGLRANFAEYSASNSDKVHSDKDINFDYFNIAWPVTRWWRMGLGILPKSNVGYEFTLSNNDGNVNNFQQFIGKGGVNKFNFTQAFIPFKNLYLGVNVSYLFGEIENDKRVFLTDANAMNYFEDETLTVKDVMFDFGMQYSTLLSKNHKLAFGAVFNTKSSIRTDRELIKRTVSTTSGAGSQLFGDTTKTSFDYPMTWGIGVAYHYKDKFTFAVDYSKSLWSKTSFVDGTSFEDDQKIAAGLEYTPDRGSLRNYFKTVTYRFGGYCKNTYLQLNGERIKDYGMTFGVGIPMRRTATNINVAVELGQRGTLSNNLVKEKYAKVSVSFSMFSRWFYKQKYE